MKAHRILIGIATLGLLTVAAVSFAGNMNGGMMHGGGMHGNMMVADCPNNGQGQMGQGQMGQGMMGHGMMGHGQRMGNRALANLTPEQQTKYAALQDAYSKKTESLRTDMWAKHTELEALSGNDKVEPKYITQLVQDMKEIGVKLRAERDVFNAQVEKELGIKGFGRGYVNCPYAEGTTPEAPVAAPAN